MIASAQKSLEAPEVLVAKLSREAKGTVLALLLKELTDLHGGRSLIPIVDGDGEPLGHYVPPDAEKLLLEAALSEMPESVREKMSRPLPDDFDADDCLSQEELASIRKGEFRKNP